MKNVRGLLRVDGKMLFSEPTATLLSDSVVFGSLPNCSRGNGLERQDGSQLTESRWDNLLETTGFPGIDASYKLVLEPQITTGHLTSVGLDYQYGVVLALDTPFWSDLTEDDLKTMQRLIASARGFLWVT
ncbi:MAG: hypothetical protein Q9204_004399 [Flavoplaca sp. TL-2023a]